MIAECQNSGYPKKGCVELFAFLTIIIASLGIFAEEALVVPNQPEPKFEYEPFVTLPQEELSLPSVPNTQNVSDLSPFPRDLELLIPPPPQAPTRLLEVPLFAAVLGPLQFAGIGYAPSWLGMKESNKFLWEKELETLDKQLRNLHALKTPGHKTGFYIIRLEFKSKYPVPQEIKDIVEKYADSNNLVVVES